MCGICGIINPVNLPAREREVRIMTDLLKHRGPDGDGFYINNNVALGHRRLKVIDLETGHQPMSTENDALWLVFNGEIYNYIELKKQLISKGHNFRTESDSEVILHLYEEKGKDCVADLCGMFSFVIWDRVEQTAFFAVDRAGQKPLYYMEHNGAFVFASELKAFAALQDFNPQVEHWALDYFISFQYVPYPWTILTGVRKLSPGHRGNWKDGKISTERYWEYRFDKKIKMSEAEWAEQVRAGVTDSVKKRLVSDVPLGAFLSGGVDSSVIVALMSGMMSAPVKTFSAGFDDADYDESKWADLVAKKFKTEHFHINIQPPSTNELCDIFAAYDEPFADSSSLPTYLISRFAREHVTVVLSGDGGDEMFGGYDRYRGMAIAKKLDIFPKFARSVASTFKRFLPRDNDLSSRVRKVRRFLWGLPLKPEKRYAAWLSVFVSEERRALYTKEFYNTLPHAHTEKLVGREFNRLESASNDVIDRVIAVDLSSYLPGDLLTKVDRAGMAHGLEVRAPFLDHYLMDLCVRMPSRMKIRGGLGKYILRRAFKKELPAEILNRGKKGFGMPVSKWLRSVWRDFAKEVLLDKITLQRDYFRAGEIFRILCEHFEARSNFGHKIWTLLALELWQREWSRLQRVSRAAFYNNNVDLK